MGITELPKEYCERGGKKGFFLELYKTVCKELTPEQEAHVQQIHGDTGPLLQFTQGLDCLRSRIKVEEAFPGKSAEEAKKMKEAGNK
jgi:hypothetical protein